MIGTEGEGSHRLVGSGYILAVDTSGREGSLALGRYVQEERSVELLVESKIEAEKEQAARLIPDSGVDG